MSCEIQGCTEPAAYDVSVSDDGEVWARRRLCCDHADKYQGLARFSSARALFSVTAEEMMRDLNQ